MAARSLSVVEDKITLPQYRALVLLGSRGDQNVGALARRCLRSIHRQRRDCAIDSRVRASSHAPPSAESRREITLKLAPAGARLLRAVTARRRTEIHEILARLSRDERRRLRAAFEVFGAAAGELPDDAWKLGWTMIAFAAGRLVGCVGLRVRLHADVSRRAQFRALASRSRHVIVASALVGAITGLSVAGFERLTVNVVFERGVADLPLWLLAFAPGRRAGDRNVVAPRPGPRALAVDGRYVSPVVSPADTAAPARDGASHGRGRRDTRNRRSDGSRRTVDLSRRDLGFRHATALPSPPSRCRSQPAARRRCRGRDRSDLQSAGHRSRLRDRGPLPRRPRSPHAAARARRSRIRIHRPHRRQRHHTTIPRVRIAAPLVRRPRGRRGARHCCRSRRPNLRVR